MKPDFVIQKAIVGRDMWDLFMRGVGGSGLPVCDSWTSQCGAGNGSYVIKTNY